MPDDLGHRRHVLLLGRDVDGVKLAWSQLYPRWVAASSSGSRHGTFRDEPQALVHDAGGHFAVLVAMGR